MGKEYSLAELEVLAKDKQEEFLELLDILPAVKLTFALEFVGQYFDEYKAIPLLISFSKMLDPLTREGALLAMKSFPESTLIQARALELSLRDSSPGVRQTAEEVLDGYFRA